MGEKLGELLKDDGSHYCWLFRCPGCEDTHHVRGWTWNGSKEAPTFSPSILVYSHQAMREDNTIYSTPQCHSFVTDGRIQFLSDCTHALAGQTVDLPDWIVSP